MKKFIVKILMKFLNLYRGKRREKLADHSKYNVEEIFMNQNKLSGFNRLDIVVRYLAIEDYYGKNKYGFELYKKMQGKRIDEEYIETSVDAFVKLIESFERGYDEQSEIVLDEGLDLVDGSHRMALALYHGVKEISCKVYNEKIAVNYGVEWFLKNDFSLNEIQIILDKCKELISNHRRGISLILWPPANVFFDEIIEKLSTFYEISTVREFVYNNTIFERIVRGVYHIDDIDEWKIDKKMEYMSAYQPKVKLAYIWFDTPEFRRKKKNGKTLSAQGEIVKDIIRSCYKSKVENYFHDVIIHTADNYEQSEYIDDIFNAHIPMKHYLKLIENIEYMMIKTETEYMPKDFPENIPFSKDADIIVSENDYNKLISMTKEFFEKELNGKYEIRIIDSSNNFRLRIENKGFLIYQIDISKKVEGLKQNFIRESLTKRKNKNGYYVSEDSDEVYYRMNEYEIRPNKIWHKKYVEEHITLYCEERMNSIRER